MLIRLTTLLLLLVSLQSLAQTGTIKGRVLDNVSKEPIPFVNIVVYGTQVGGTTDIDGKFQINEIPVGYVKLEATYVGYKPAVTADYLVTRNKTPFVEISLEPSQTNLKEFVVESAAFQKTEESPVSLQTIGVEEIEKNPGGNRDISRTIQSLPGVASFPGFRNDIIIRGGGPAENKFYIDGIETPLINHFQTQGASGGPVGMLNTDLIREVNLYTGAFPANRSNSLSSIMEIKQKDGDKEKLHLRGTVGSNDLGITIDGPIGQKTSFVASVRHSYLQFLFSVLKLPFLPTYTDAQFKVKHRFNDKNELSIIGLGAIDQFELNKDVNDGVTDADRLERNNYTLANIPENGQWNYTVGTVYKHYSQKSSQTFVLSRNYLDNSAFKHIDNNESLPKTLDYNSSEAENKFRFEHTTRGNLLKWNFGVNLEHAEYTNSTFNLIPTPQGVIQRDFSSKFDMMKYGAWIQLSKVFGKLTLSGGVRADGNNYNDDMQNALNQLSPRVSAAFALTDKWSLNANIGRYYQLPAYTILGFRDNANNLVNKDRTTYIQADHFVTGVQFNPDKLTKITVEGFYKNYQDYPFSLVDSISIANKGAGFGVVGNEATASTSEGRAYGAELLIQRRSKNGLFGILAYTYVKSEFKDKTGEYRPSSWDSKNFVSLTAGKKFKGNWQVGAKWRFSGGLPYTPYNIEASALKSNWDAQNRGIFDFDNLNSERLGEFHQLDIRVDKIFYFNRFSLNLYLDIQNLYAFGADQIDILNVRSDDQGNKLTDPNDPQRYQTYFIKNQNRGTVIPTFGVILDF